jgi:glyoxylase-like metal-dependent hydrolase (beta-lactamase superfamily II)
MRRPRIIVIAAALALVSVSCSKPAGTLEAAEETLGAANLHSIEYSGTGKWFQFGQAPNPTLPWPPFDVSSFKATIDYATPSALVEIVRKQTLEPPRVRPAPVEQRSIQVVSGTSAWNLAPAAGAAPGSAPVPQPQPSAAVEERIMEIWATPQGFLKAARANNATSEAANGGSTVSFTASGKKYVGSIDAQSRVEKIQTWLDTPVLGDTLVETTFSNYRDFTGVMFPGRIVRTQGAYPVLDITISEVKLNPPVAIAVPDQVKNFTPPPAPVSVQKLADGVYYLTGAAAHTIAVDQSDHIVAIEAPASEARSQAVIAKIKETIPNKPIRYVVNSHVHFDHSGGLRTYVDEGATVVTHQMNRPYYEQAWAAPRTLNPDRLAQSKKAAKFEVVTDKHVLTDKNRNIEIHQIADSGHNDGFLMVYLPKEKILIEGDAFTPGAADAPPPAVPNPYAVNLNDNITRLKLDVRQIAALHGPRVATMADLRSAIGAKPNPTD